MNVGQPRGIPEEEEMIDSEEKPSTQQNTSPPAFGEHSLKSRSQSLPPSPYSSLELDRRRSLLLRAQSERSGSMPRGMRSRGSEYSWIKSQVDYPSRPMSLVPPETLYPKIFMRSGSTFTTSDMSERPPRQSQPTYMRSLRDVPAQNLYISPRRYSVPSDRHSLSPQRYSFSKDKMPASSPSIVEFNSELGSELDYESELVDFQRSDNCSANLDHSDNHFVSYIESCETIQSSDVNVLKKKRLNPHYCFHLDKLLLQPANLSCHSPSHSLQSCLEARLRSLTVLHSPRFSVSRQTLLSSSPTRFKDESATTSPDREARQGPFQLREFMNRTRFLSSPCAECIRIERLVRHEWTPSEESSGTCDESNSEVFSE